MKTLTYHGQPFATVDNLYRVKDDDPPRQHPTIPCPPQVNPMVERPIPAASTIRTPMSRYRWEDHLRKINRDMFDVAVARHLIMFNGQDDWEHGNDKMESLICGRNWVLAVPTMTWGWHRVLTLKYEDGPPKELPTYDENPLAVQKLTMICRKGAVLARNLFYPVVARYPVYIQSDRLEPYSQAMLTPPPPAGSKFMDDLVIAAQDFMYWLGAK